MRYYYLLAHTFMVGKNLFLILKGKGQSTTKILLSYLFG